VPSTRRVKLVEFKQVQLMIERHPALHKARLRFERLGPMPEGVVFVSWGNEGLAFYTVGQFIHFLLTHSDG
jgi:hypothetical protein